MSDTRQGEAERLLAPVLRVRLAAWVVGVCGGGLLWLWLLNARDAAADRRSRCLAFGCDGGTSGPSWWWLAAWLTVWLAVWGAASLAAMWLRVQAGDGVRDDGPGAG